MLFNFLYKVFGWLISIDEMVTGVLVVGCGLLFFKRFYYWGRRFVTVGVAIVFLTVMLPTGEWLAVQLENHFPQVTAIPEGVKGAILLGGSFHRPISVKRGVTSYTSAAGRFIAFSELAYQNPNLQLVFTGGGVNVKGAKSESQIAKEIWQNLGFDTSKIIFEDRSVNTIENAKLTYDLVQPKKGEKYLLVTSAMHMPRSVGLFENAGWEVIPYPVDYHTPGTVGYKLNLSLRKGFQDWYSCMREYAAMVNNYFSGHSATLFGR